MYILLTVFDRDEFYITLGTFCSVTVRTCSQTAFKTFQHASVAIHLIAILTQGITLSAS